MKTTKKHIICFIPNLDLLNTTFNQIHQSLGVKEITDFTCFKINKITNKYSNMLDTILNNIDCNNVIIYTIKSPKITDKQHTIFNKYIIRYIKYVSDDFFSQPAYPREEEKIYQKNLKEFPTNFFVLLFSVIK